MNSYKAPIKIYVIFWRTVWQTIAIEYFRLFSDVICIILYSQMTSSCCRKRQVKIAFAIMNNKNKCFLSFSKLCSFFNNWEIMCTTLRRINTLVLFISIQLLIITMFVHWFGFLRIAKVLKSVKKIKIWHFVAPPPP